MQSEQQTRNIGEEGITFAAQIDDGAIMSFAYGTDTARTLCRSLQLGLSADELLDHSTRDRRDKVRALANALGYAVGEIESGSRSPSAVTTTTDSDSEARLLEEEWPYEHVEPEEVERNLSYQEAKELRQELEDLRSTIDDWACDECEERKSVCYNPASGNDRCRVCAGFEDPDTDADTEAEP
ncbi:hypothetical protein [Natronorubrum sp. DTA7]|uniref:hypothetical protein n=1 Tax=Natronorubrum sp. DTA7 TaxID=3447016 RepID=UPI003F8744D0